MQCIAGSLDVSTVRKRVAPVQGRPHFSFPASTVEQPVFLAQLHAAIRKKEPIVFYYWTPEWIFASYDLRMLEEPPHE